MPTVTHIESAKNVSNKKVQENFASSSSKKSNKQPDRCIQAVPTQSTPSKKKKRATSPVYESSPGKQLKSNNDILISKLEESEKRDLILQQKLREATEGSGDAPFISIYKSKNINRAEQKQLLGSTTNGSSIVYVAPLHVQSDSEDDNNDKSQECPPKDHIDCVKSDEMRALEAKYAKLFHNYKILDGKYSLLMEKFKEVKKKLTRKKANTIAKPPPVVLKWMAGVVHATDKQGGRTKLTPAQCAQIITDAAPKLKVLPEQLRLCRRDTMQQTSRRLAFLVWPDPISRGSINSKNVDRDTLNLMNGVCSALHPDLEADVAVMNKAIFNVCSTTKTKARKSSTKLNVSQDIDIDDIALPPLIIDEHDEHDEQVSDDDDEAEEDDDDVHGSL